MINFLILVNKRGQPRIRKYYNCSESEVQLEPDLIKKCVLRDEKLCSFFDHHGRKILYRKYGTLYFVVGITEDENELGVWEFLHNVVETLNEYFQKVTEIDIMMNIDRVHIILDEMICNGYIVESSRQRILAPMRVMDQAMKK